MIGLLAAAGLLLIVAGVSKVRAPEAARAALTAARMPAPSVFASRISVRFLGLAQVAAGAAIPFLDQRGAGLVVLVAFSALAAFSWRLATVAPGQACGCFGASDGPVHPWHLAMNVVFSVAGAAAFLQSGPGFTRELTTQPLWGLPLLALTAMLARACYLVTSALPRLSAAHAATEVAR